MLMEAVNRKTLVDYSGRVITSKFRSAGTSRLACGSAEWA
jgi:hypothetical protein